MFSRKSILQFKNIAYTADHKTIFEQVSGSIPSDAKIGLVGNNGSGKSTLLKILTGKLKGSEGEIWPEVDIEYVPQLHLKLYNSDLLLYQYLETLYAEWWDVLLMLEKQFSTELNPSRVLKSLSGGELVKLHIALALTRKPKLLLLDEPTNHLDESSVDLLSGVLEESRVPFIVVSHNRHFLNETTNTTWELASATLTAFGGNYDFYVEEKERIKQNQLHLYSAAKKKVAKLESALQKEKKRATRTEIKGRSIAKINDRGTSRADRFFLTNSAQKAAGKNKHALEHSISEADKQVGELKPEKYRSFYVPLSKKRKQQGLLLSIENGVLAIDERVLISNVSLKIRHGERIKITGNNGMGKSLLVKNLFYKESLELSGKIVYGKSYQTAYLDQHYTLLEPTQNIDENFERYIPGTSYGKKRSVLAGIGFLKQSDLNRLVSSLSGGEIAKLTFGLIALSDFDMLILDEPTNNLDIKTREKISELLQNFVGTIVLITHDKSFREAIHIDKCYKIVGGAILKE